MLCMIARKYGSVGKSIYPLIIKIRYWRLWLVWKVMLIRSPNQWLRDTPCEFLIRFISSTVRDVAMRSVFSNDVSTRKGEFWNFTSSFFFVTQYYWIMILMVWSVWSILIPYSHWILLLFWSFCFGPSWKLKSKRVSNYWIITSNQIIFNVFMSM